MRPLLHTVPLLFAVLLALSGCNGRAAVEDTVQREIEAITAMKQLSLVEYRVSKIVKADDDGVRYVNVNFNICQSISRLLHGRIWYDAEYTGGTRFYFEVPKEP